MEGIQDFETKVRHAVSAARQELDSTLLPRMQKDIMLMSSACNTVLSALIKKSIFHNSSARYTDQVEEIIPPSKEPFNEKERVFVLGSRFGQYLAMLDFAAQYYQFNCSSLTPSKIAKLNDLFKSFNWDSLLLSSDNPNTSCFAEIMQNFRKCGDSLAINIVSDGISQLSRTLSSVMRTLKTVSDYHREDYKLSIRENVLPKVDVPGDPPDVDEWLKAVKKAFAQTMKGQPFYTDLIKEIFYENYGPDVEHRRAEVLSKFEKAAKQETVEEPAIDYRAQLVDGIKTLGGTSAHIQALAGKLAENQKIMQAAQMTFFKKLKDLFRRAFGLPPAEYEITIVLTDPATQIKKRETVNLNFFIDNLKRKARLFSGFSTKNSVVWQKLDPMTDTQLLDVLSRNLSEINALMRQCGGVDEYFKTQAKGEAKSKIKGVKIELSTIKNIVLKVNKIRADYSARIEEEEQLKRLGIK